MKSLFIYKLKLVISVNVECKYSFTSHKRNKNHYLKNPKQSNSMKVVLFLTSCILLIIVQRCRAETDRPNVVIFLADDLGFGDLPFFGHPSSKTPNLNKLAKKSKVFSDFYVASPVCSPSRYQTDNTFI